MAADAATQATDLPRHLKIIAGADDFGCSLKDALVTHLRSLGIEGEDIGTGKYYTVGQEIGRRVSTASTSAAAGSVETRGLVACGTGVGVAIFANKYPGTYASTCESVEEAINARSINNCNILAVGGMKTPPEEGIEILEAWLNTPFKSPCPASGSSPWPDEIRQFLDDSLVEMPLIPDKKPVSDCAICCLAAGREFEPVTVMPGGSMKIVRQSPTSAVVRFKAGSVEPAHRHTHGHDVLVLKGRKKVWNLSKSVSYVLKEGDYLFTPAGDVHRVKYFEDTEFFIRWDGDWDIFLEEELEVAVEEIKKDLDDD